MSLGLCFCVCLIPAKLVVLNEITLTKPLTKPCEKCLLSFSDPQSINLINEASDVLNRICGDGSDDNLRRQSSNNIRLSSKSTQK